MRLSLILSSGIAAFVRRAASGQQAPYNSATISGLGARNIGSATMSGRVSALAAHREPSGKLTIFVGAASGGVWKSEDGGTHYRPVFDEQPVQSIGAIALDPKNSKNVWVGTGERGPATASRSATASTNRPTAARPGTSPACQTRSASRRSSLVRRAATRFMRRCRARSGAIRPIAVSTRRPTAARRGT